MAAKRVRPCACCRRRTCIAIATSSRTSARGDFADARADIAKLADTSLMGYVLAEHYLSPHSGRTKLAELNDWLERYGDLSIADRIYRLAHKRAKAHITPACEDIPGFRWRGGGYEDVDVPDPPMTAPRLAHRADADREYDPRRPARRSASSPAGLGIVSDANAADVAG